MWIGIEYSQLAAVGGQRQQSKPPCSSQVNGNPALPSRNELCERRPDDKLNDEAIQISN
jgi:hypothetical protein